jgi:Zn-dependent oligopeptidase
VLGKNENSSPSDRFYLEREYGMLVRAGARIRDSVRKEKLGVVKGRIKDLELLCCKNIRESRSGIFVSEAKMEGVPQDALERFKRGGDGEEGERRYWVRFKQADLSLCLAYAVREETRRVWVGSQNNCAQNVEVMKEIVCLRSEMAGCLGCGCWAE